MFDIPNQILNTEENVLSYPLWPPESSTLPVVVGSGSFPPAGVGASEARSHNLRSLGTALRPVRV